MKSYSDPQVTVIQAVDLLLTQALSGGASDIHLEPTAENLRVRFRLDGVLHDMPAIAATRAQNVIARIKVLAHIDTAEQRLPQDGALMIRDKNRSADVRISTFPTLHGEKVVIRLLNRAHAFLHLDQLGFSPTVHAKIKKIIDRPQGLFLVTGPTGSGKTTTLYALLSYLNKSACNIITLEDPVEYHIDGISQGQINERIGFDFAHGMRSILRQDPDVIMVGEIRDAQTAQTAIRAALTGHLVLSTLHTNDAPSAIIRLIDMGVPPYLLLSALSGVLAQRLMRVLCTCKKEQNHVDLPAILARASKKIGKICVPVGCTTCTHIGYKGRMGIFECMVLDDALRELILQNASLANIREYACKKQGMHTLLEQALEKVAAGVSTLEEVARVCDI